MPRMNLQASSSIVTGGASGIGEAAARQLAEAGSRVVIADLQEDKGQAVASELGGLFVKCDVSNVEDAQSAVAAASEMGPLRALVNSAGLGRAARTIDRNNVPADLGQFEFVIKINLLGTYNMLAQSAAAMAQTEPVDQDGSRGAIVNMASAAAFDGQIGQAAYSASKGGLLALTRTLAVEYGRKGLRANSVCPGSVKTAMHEQFSLPEGADESLLQRIMALDRFRGPDAAAAVVAFLASEDAAHVNGEEIRVDGGTLA